MKIYMWIDDDPVRDPKNTDHPWIIIRTFDQAIDFFQKFGIPNYIDFDHDLADTRDDKTGMAIAKWLIEYDLDNGMNKIPKDFSFRVHSSNPNGGDNIQYLLDNYLKTRKERRLENPT